MSLKDFIPEIEIQSSEDDSKERGLSPFDIVNKIFSKEPLPIEFPSSISNFIVLRIISMDPRFTQFAADFHRYINLDRSIFCKVLQIVLPKQNRFYAKYIKSSKVKEKIDYLDETANHLHMSKKDIFELLNKGVITKNDISTFFGGGVTKKRARSK